MTKEPTASDVMTEGVIAIEGDATVQEAAQKMRGEDIRSLVVVDGDEAVGIIVGRDVLYEVAAEGLDPFSVSVDEVMTSNLVTASESDNIEDIARAMIENDISRVPIMRGENLVGIVTQSNLMSAWPPYVELLQEESRAFGGEAVEEESETAAVRMESESPVNVVCASCENFSEDLVPVDGELLCPECRENGLV